MKIVIIEDEKLTAEDLAETITRLRTDTEVVAILQSAKEGLSFLKMPHEVDLIFSDIQLGDGLSFEIFHELQLKAPVIFCTAFDEYALEAFKVNGIDYILKPFTDATVAAALNKFVTLKETLAPKVPQYQEMMKFFQSQRSTESGSLLVRNKDKIIPIEIKSIAFFQLKNALVYLTTFDNKTYFVSKNLEEIERLTGALFFRVNRQFLINRKAVVDASSYLSRKISVKLTVPTPDIVTVSKEKISAFMEWLERV